MPRTARQSKEMRQASRRRILEAALALFARQGYDATSVRQIAGRAGVSQGLLYNYFDGKEDVLRELFRQGMDDVQASFGESAAGATPAERLRRLICAALGIVDENRDFWRLLYQLRWQPDVLERLDVDLHRWNGAIRSRIAELTGGRAAESVDGAAERAAEADSEAAADPETARGRALFAAIDGAAQHMVLEPETYPTEAVCEELVRRFAPGSGQSPHPFRRYES